jgi:co-chaperonin GroES (HSP10)
MNDLEEAVAKGTRGWRAAKGHNDGNKSGFRATGHRVLLVGQQVEEQTESGIIIQRKTAEAERNLSVTATVVEIGHDCWFDKSTDYAEVGDTVLVGQYTGKFHTSHLDGREYRFVNDTDIITTVENV